VTMVIMSKVTLDSLRAELRKGLSQYRSCGIPAQREGCRTQIAALVKLAERVLDASGMSEAEQGELFEPIRKLDAALSDLNHWGHPPLLKPMPVGSRPPVGMSEAMVRGDLVAAFDFWRQAHRGADKSKNVLFTEVAHKFDVRMRGETIKEYRRIAVSGRDPRLTERYREMLEVAKTKYPGDPASAALALIRSAKAHRT
jgi:hypothetical protein